MNAIIEETKFRVYSDLLDNEKEQLYDRILNNNRENKNALVKSISENQDSTYYNIGNDIKKYFDLPKYNDNTYIAPTSFQLVQEWEGYVQQIHNDENIFTAILLDITANDEFPTEEADFNLDDIREFDFHFLRPGAVFRWVIGYTLKRKINKNGFVSVTKVASSSLVFRRMPKWNQSSLDKAAKRAKEFKDEIIWE